MSSTFFRISAAVSAFAVVLASASATDQTTPVRAPSAFGDEIEAPDVWVCSLPSTVYWGESGGIMAFSVATTSANAGNVDLSWIQNSTLHPVIAQNMYRLKDGVLQQIGISWLKHGFCSLQNVGCGNCEEPTQQCLSVLRPGCADPYNATLNANANLLGPRSEVNPASGDFLWPHSTGSGPSTIRSRLQVNAADVLPEMNPGARYFVEGHYVHPEDAQAGLGDNNATHREISFDGFSFVNPPNTVPSVGSSFGAQPAIRAWAANTTGVQLSELTREDGADGLFIIGSRAQDLGNGSWRYDYAVYNMNSDRSGGSLSVPIPDGAAATNFTFHAPFYHSGEPYSGDPWTVTETGGAVVWSVVPFDQDFFANAVRWSTMYSFSFEIDAAPGDGAVELGMFKPSPGAPDAFEVPATVPIGAVCIGDLTGDGEIDGADLAVLLSQWDMSGSADLNGSGKVDGADLAILLANWGDCR